jgi:hypothetical protein
MFPSKSILAVEDGVMGYAVTTVDHLDGNIPKEADVEPLALLFVYQTERRMRDGHGAAVDRPLLFPTALPSRTDGSPPARAARPAPRRWPRRSLR